MTLVEYLEQFIEAFNQEQKCGFSWNFIHGRPDYTNLQIPTGKEGYVQFMLEWWKLRQVVDLSPIKDTVLRDEYQFKIFIGLNSDFDIQYHNELDYDKSEGKYERYIKQLETCLISDFRNNICLYPNTKLTSWSYEPKINYKDSNYDGGFLTGTIYFVYN